MSGPVLAIENLTVALPILGRPATRRRWRLARGAAQGDPLCRRRIRFGQVGDGQGRFAPAAGTARAGDGRAHHLRQPGPADAAVQWHSRRARRPHRHDFPGAHGGAQPADDRRAADRRDHRGPHAHAPVGASPTRHRGVRRRAPTRARAHPEELSARAFRRPAAAGDDRHGAGAGAGPDHCRRADHCTRRHHPGANPALAQGAARTPRHRHPVHYPRFRGGGGDRRPGGSDAAGQACRTGAGQRRPAAPPTRLHASAGGCGAESQPAP